MVTFLVSLAMLVVGYAVYGLVAEKVFSIDTSRQTPAVTKADGVDFVAMPTWRVFLI